MNLFFRALKFQLVVVVAVCMYGCSDKTQPSLKQSVAQIKQIKQKEAKPGASVKLISSSILTINPNEKTSFEMLLEAKDASGELTVDLSVPDELSLLDTPMHHTINLSSSNIKIPVNLLAVANGRYYLKVHARINNGDTTSERNLAVIIQVGPNAEKSVQLEKRSGENVISLPAQETISTQ